MKIAIICSYDFSIAWSLEIFVKKLLLNNEITAICDIHEGYKYGHYIEKVKKWGVKHRYVKAYRFISPYQDLKYIFKLYKILNAKHYDMVINIATKPNIYGTIAARWSKVKNMKKKINVEYIDIPPEIRPNYQYYTQANMTKMIQTITSSNTNPFEFTSLEDGIADYVNNYLTSEDPYL